MYAWACVVLSSMSTREWAFQWDTIELIFVRCFSFAKCNWIGIYRFQIVLFGFERQMRNVICSCYQRRQIDCRLFTTNTFHDIDHMCFWFMWYAISFRFASFPLVIYVGFKRNSSITDTTIHCRCDENSMLKNCLCVFFFALAQRFFFRLLFSITFFRTSFGSITCVPFTWSNSGNVLTGTHNNNSMRWSLKCNKNKWANNFAFN